MGRRSSIKSLPEPVRAAIDAAIRGDQLTLDEILEMVEAEFVEEFGDDAVPSRSALGRHAKTERERMQKFIEAQSVAQTWAAETANRPESEIAKVFRQMITTLAFNSGREMMDGEAVDVKALNQLARAYNYIENAGRISDTRERQLRTEEREAAANDVEEAARAQGLGEDQVEFWRKKVLGIG